MLTNCPLIQPTTRPMRMISGSIRQSCPVCIGRFMGSAGSWTLFYRQMAQLHQRPWSDPRHP
jgi:hypothetical protein